MAKRSAGFDMAPPGKVARTAPRVVAARITELACPGQSPLGGLTVDDVHAAFSSAGCIEKIVCASKPPLTHVDALVQYQDPASADIAVQQWNGVSLTGNTQHVLIEVKYSRHVELTVQNNNRCKDYTQGALAMAVQSAGLVDPTVKMYDPVAAVAARMAAVAAGKATTAPPRVVPPRVAPPLPAPPLASGAGGRRVVLARMTNLRCPDQNPLGGITVADVHAVFNMISPVDKIVCASSPKTGPPLGCVDAMVEFKTEAGASASIQALQGWSLTGDGHFIMKLELSRKQELRVTTNTDRSWNCCNELVSNHQSLSDQLALDQLVNHHIQPMGDQSWLGDRSLGDQSLALFPGAASPMGDQSWPELAGLTPFGQHAGAGQYVIVAHIRDLYNPEQNPLGGLTVENVHAAFSIAGLIQKIVCCSSPKTGPPLSHVDAMVQFATPEAAAIAVSMFNGHALTGDGRNNMNVEFSKNTELVVNRNNSRCRDYTTDGGAASAASIGGLASLDLAALSSLGAPLAIGSSPAPVGSHRSTRQYGSNGPVGAVWTNRVVAAHFNQLARPDEGPLGGIDVDVVHEIFAQAGGIEKIVCSTTPKGMPLKSVTALVQFVSKEATDQAHRLFANTSLTGDGFNNITLQQSDRPELVVKSNCSRSWDYLVQPTSGDLGGLKAYDPVRFS